MTPPYTEPFWEPAYRADSRPFGPPSLEVVELLERLPRSSRVLDLGCGDGRNTIPLARAGHRVTAIDRSRSALDALRRAAAREGGSIEDETPLGIEIVHADLAHLSPLDDYDLIIAHGVLHLLAREDRDWLIERIRRHTLPGGWNVLAVFTDAVPPPDDLAPLCRGLFKPGELFLRYGDWDIELEEAYVLEDEHPGGERHRHAIEKLVARRPE